jgi:hypothetical protein
MRVAGESHRPRLRLSLSIRAQPEPSLSGVRVQVLRRNAGLAEIDEFS